MTNLLVVGPTSSGKTLVGEMAAASSSYRTRRHGIFLVPYRALAAEHYANFRDRYGELLNVVISTSDWTEFDDDIRSGNFGLAVLTYEKLTGLLVDHPQQTRVPAPAEKGTPAAESPGQPRTGCASPRRRQKPSSPR